MLSARSLSCENSPKILFSKFLKFNVSVFLKLYNLDHGTNTPPRLLCVLSPNQEIEEQTLLDACSLPLHALELETPYSLAEESL